MDRVILGDGGMEINRNQYMMIGIVILLLGVQMRMIHSYVLTEKAAEFVADKLKSQEAPAIDTPVAFWPAFQPMAPPSGRRTVRPPNWLGWVLLSLGGVFVLHSLAMPRPG